MKAESHDEGELQGYEPVEPASLEETTELIEYFKKQVDREALRENLKLTPAQRVEKMERILREKYPDPLTSTPAQPMHESRRQYEAANISKDRPVDATTDLVEAFKKDIDRTLLIENLKLTPEQRTKKFLGFMQSIYEVREAGRRWREQQERDVSGKN